MDEEDEVGIGMADKARRLRPFMFHELARQYVKAAGAVQMENDFSPVHHFLCCMSIELSLKAFLLTKGLSVSRLKKLGHDLERGLEEAEFRGLFGIVEINSQSKEVLRKANYFYKRKQGFQYADEEEVLMEFGRLFQSGKVLYELASILVEQLHGVCFECVHNVLGKKSMRELIAYVENK
jgi:hypothetical protein